MVFKKLTAIVTAATMFAGSGVVAFAAPTDSPTNSPVPVPVNPGTTGNEAVVGTATGEDGKEYQIVPEQLPQDVIQEIGDSDSVKEIIEAAGYDVPEDADAVVIASGDYQLQVKEGDGEWVDTEYTSGQPLTFTFDLSDGDVQVGDTVYVLHKVAEGQWEVTATTVKEIKDGKAVVDVTVTSLSPIAIVKIMSNGDVVKLEKKDENKPGTGTEEKPGTDTGTKPGTTTTDKTNTTTNTTKTSPKTGV